MSTILPIAQQYNLTLHAFGSVAYNGSSKSSLNLTTAWGSSLEPAPRTPADLNSDEETRPYELLMGTIKAALKASPEHRDKKVVVRPTLMFGGLHFTHKPDKWLDY